MPRNVNLIMPTDMVIHQSPIHSVRQTMVVINPDKAHHFGGKKGTPNETLMFTSVQLSTIAAAAGVSIVKSSPQETAHEAIFSHKVTASIVTNTGETLITSGTYMIDLRAPEYDGVAGARYIRALSDRRKRRDTVRKTPAWRNKTEPLPTDSDEVWDAWAVKIATEEMVQKRSFGTQLAETGAKNRAIRSLCSMPHSVTRQEMSRPFAVVKVVVDFGAAIKMGGHIGEQAQSMLMGAMAKQLGMSPQDASGLIDVKALSSAEVDQGMLYVTQEEADELYELMIEAGFKNHGMCDKKTGELFGLTVNQLTVHHADVIRELVSYVARAMDVLDLDDFELAVSHFNEVATLAGATGENITGLVDAEWYDKLYGETEEAEEDEEAKEEESDNDEVDDDDSTEDEVSAEEGKDNDEESVDNDDEGQPGAVTSS